MRNELFQHGSYMWQLSQTSCSTVHSSRAACGDLFCVAPHGLQGDSLLHHRPLLGYRKLLCIWSTPFLPRCLQSHLHFLTPPSCSCCTAFFYPFSNILSKKCNQHCLLAQLWPSMSPCWICQELALVQHDTPYTF